MANPEMLDWNTAIGWSNDFEADGSSRVLMLAASMLSEQMDAVLTELKQLNANLGGKDGEQSGPSEKNAADPNLDS